MNRISEILCNVCFEAILFYDFQPRLGTMDPNRNSGKQEEIAKRNKKITILAIPLIMLMTIILLKVSTILSGLAVCAVFSCATYTLGALIHRKYFIPKKPRFSC